MAGWGRNFNLSTIPHPSVFMYCFHYWARMNRTAGGFVQALINRSQKQVKLSVPIEKTKPGEFKTVRTVQEEIEYPTPPEVR
jgi:hypothetical protein